MDKEIQKPIVGNKDHILRRSLDVDFGTLDAEARKVDVVASTSAIDSHGDILEQDWRLDRYRRNPVVLWNHNQFDSSRMSFGGAVRPEDLMPIGTAENVGVVDNQLRATLVFPEGISATADQVWRMMKAKVLRAVSVGFRPGRVTKEEVDGKKVFRLGNNELIEISVVPVPSNPETVAASIDADRQWLSRQIDDDTAPGDHADITAETNEMGMSDTEKQKYDATIQSMILDKEKTSKEVSAAIAIEIEKREKAEARAEAAVARAKAAEGRVIEAELKTRVGKKITPAQVAKYTEWAQKLGVDEVLEQIDAGPDLKLTQEVKVRGKSVETDPIPDPASEDPGADLWESLAASGSSN